MFNGKEQKRNDAFQWPCPTTGFPSPEFMKFTTLVEAFVLIIIRYLVCLHENYW